MNNNQNKLYVGNLDYSVTTDDLRELFSEVGNVIDAIVITDRATGRSKGFGFVQFDNEEDAKKAMDEFDGKEFKGRNMVVNEARPKRKRSDNFRSNR